MTNDELKKKICEIIAPYVSAWGEDERIADALIAAGIGDVKDLQVQVDSLEITNIALQAGYDDAEKDRLYWVDKYKEAELRAEVAESELERYTGLIKPLEDENARLKHRAEVAERALHNCCFNMIYAPFGVVVRPTVDELYKAHLERAEKELQEEKKDD